MIVLAARYGLLFHCDPMTAFLDRDPSDVDLLIALGQAAQRDLQQ